MPGAPSRNWEANHSGRSTPARLSSGRDARLAGGDETHDGASEFGRELLEIDFELVLLGDVEHVDDHHHRHLHFNQLGREVEVALEVRAVDDVDHRFGFAREDVVASDALVFARGGGGRDRIDAWKVDELDRLSFVRKEARLLVDGDAGPVADALARARQGVEERGFAAVRIADHANDVLSHDVREVERGGQ